MLNKNFEKVKITYFDNVEKINKQSSKILKSDKFIIISIAIFGGAAFIHTLLYGLGVFSKGDIGFSDDTKDWIIILNLTIQILAGVLSTISYTKAQRFDNDFLKFAAPAILLYILNSILLRLWFKVILSSIMLCIRIYQHFSWNVSIKKVELKTSKAFVYFSTIIFIVGTSMLLGWSMDQIPSDSGWANPSPYLDATTTSMTLTAQYFLITKNLFAHPILIVNSVLSIVLMLVNGQWMTAVRGLVSLFTTIIAMFLWQGSYYEERKAKDKIRTKVKVN